MSSPCGLPQIGILPPSGSETTSACKPLPEGRRPFSVIVQYTHPDRWKVTRDNQLVTPHLIDQHGSHTENKFHTDLLILINGRQ